MICECEYGHTCSFLKTYRHYHYIIWNCRKYVVLQSHVKLIVKRKNLVKLPYDDSVSICDSIHVYCKFE